MNWGEWRSEGVRGDDVSSSPKLEIVLHGGLKWVFWGLGGLKMGIFSPVYCSTQTCCVAFDPPDPVYFMGAKNCSLTCWGNFGSIISSPLMLLTGAKDKTPVRHLAFFSYF